MKIREYGISDLHACLSLFDSNVPKYFHVAEREMFRECLESGDYLSPRLRSAGAPKGCMYVVEVDGRVAGCGGWCLNGAVAVLNWGIVDQSLHRKGIGRFLLSERLKAICEDGRAKAVRVRTTPVVQGFFEHAGFTLAPAQVKGLIDEVPLVELTMAL